MIKIYYRNIKIYLAVNFNHNCLYINKMEWSMHKNPEQYDTIFNYEIGYFPGFKD